MQRNLSHRTRPPDMPYPDCGCWNGLFRMRIYGSAAPAVANTLRRLVRQKRLSPYLVKKTQTLSRANEQSRRSLNRNLPHKKTQTLSRIIELSGYLFKRISTALQAPEPPFTPHTPIPSLWLIEVCPLVPGGAKRHRPGRERLGALNRWSSKSQVLRVESSEAGTQPGKLRRAL